jgi:hypothetical protein
VLQVARLSRTAPTRQRSSLHKPGGMCYEWLAYSVQGGYYLDERAQPEYGRPRRFHQPLT